MTASIAAYFAFVDALLAAGYPSVVITGATLPTIRDDQDWGDVANLRREIKTSLRDRTALTFAYNDALARQARLRRLPYIDISQGLIDPATGLIADRFRHPNPTNHHLDPVTTGPLWADALNGLGRALERRAFLSVRRLATAPRLF